MCFCRAVPAVADNSNASTVDVNAAAVCREQASCVMRVSCSTSLIFTPHLFSTCSFRKTVIADSPAPKAKAVPINVDTGARMLMIDAQNSAVPRWVDRRTVVGALRGARAPRRSPEDMGILTQNTVPQIGA